MDHKLVLSALAAGWLVLLAAANIAVARAVRSPTAPPELIVQAGNRAVTPR
jgi:hypothetical protein